MLADKLSISRNRILTAFIISVGLGFLYGMYGVQ
jgi:hypothetical protein